MKRLQLYRHPGATGDVLAEAATSAATVPVDIEESRIIRFREDLRALGAGINAVALLDGECLPVADASYFAEHREPAARIATSHRDAAETTSAPPVGRRRFFLFRVPGAAGFCFALSMTQVLEVAIGLPYASLGFAHTHLPGVVVWRGEAVPFVDLAAAARLGAFHSEPYDRLLITRNRDGFVMAIPVAGSVQQPVTTAHVFAPDAVTVRAMRAVRGVFRYQGSPLLVPDLDVLVEGVLPYSC